MKHQLVALQLQSREMKNVSNRKNEMARAIVLTSCEETVKYPQ
jgi:hypothetical protein